MALGDTGDEHRIGDRECDEGWCGAFSYPRPCEGTSRIHAEGEDRCPGLVHASFGDENADGDYWLYIRCDVCGGRE
jgi:hypothetical protein